MILLYPHLSKIPTEDLLGDFVGGMMGALSRIEDAPSLMLEVYATIIGVDPLWLAKNVSVYEIILSFPVVSEVNNNLIAFLQEVLLGMTPMRQNG